MAVSFFSCRSHRAVVSFIRPSSSQLARGARNKGKHPGVAPPSAAGPTASRRLRVLVVDDEPVIREVLAEYLQGDGHFVQTAVNGRDGYEQFRGGEWDLVTTDGFMPEMNGDELALAVKQLSGSTPVFLVSGSVELVQKAGQAASAIDRVIRKPFTRGDLREAIAASFSAP